VQFLLDITIQLPHTLGADEVAELIERERERGRELVDAGTIAHIWRVPGALRNISVWEAGNATELHAAIRSLPLYAYATVVVTPLAAHPLMGGPPDG
jgi:muconolactone D-isomerase